MGDDFFLLFGVLLFLLVFVYWICVPCGRRHPLRSDREERTSNRRSTMGTRFGFRETSGQRNLGFVIGEPPPTYQWVMQHANAPLVAYVNEITGHVEYVKWDGAGPVPTRTVLGILNERVDESTHSEEGDEAIQGEQGSSIT